MGGGGCGEGRELPDKVLYGDRSLSLPHFDILEA